MNKQVKAQRKEWKKEARKIVKKDIDMMMSDFAALQDDYSKVKKIKTILMVYSIIISIVVVSYILTVKVCSVF